MLEQRLTVQEIGHAHAGAPHLVRKCWADAAAGGADGPFAPQLLVQAVDEGVPGHEHLGALAQGQPPPHGDAARLQVLDLPQQHRRVDDDAVADDADLIGVEDARRDEVQPELAQLVDHGVAGVVAGGVPGDQMGFLGQQVYDPAFALIPPLAAHHYDNWHK